MTPATRRGVYNNLFESEYYYSIYRMQFFFSSRSNMERFVNRLHGYYQEFQEKFNKRYPVSTDLRQMAAVLLYNKIEPRGFRIKLENGGEATCAEQLLFTVLVQVAK